MLKAKIIQFPIDRAVKNSGNVYEVFPREVADSFMEYHKLGVDWRNNHRKDTFYEGYPHQPPGDPMIDGLVWFTDEQKNFGVWVYNKSGEEIVVNEKIEFGWSPFVRKSVGPPNEPVHIQSSEFRKHLVWFVDEDGYGQYGVIKKDEEVWLPHPKVIK
ncbi:hypothetical protein BKP35_08990 [Anaerobacillus arseniciselenatis]|uniref:Uncharacterized protein n=1 Tax=Anaerobacillus arseniciselenatis TaxID=85682 RepID=A0A1S2LMC4_9BACI|nr:hypothetical protein [Anaerobacillus arseniciselenatis]OIJ13360.1 hypothetical protein BKP35_08990 [Anaerobacillus arseniciselenatis]